MKKFSKIAMTMLLLLLATNLYAAQKDNAKCKDHPFFTRMPDSYIYNCDHKQFDGRDFVMGKGSIPSMSRESYGGLPTTLSTISNQNQANSRSNATLRMP